MSKPTDVKVTGARLWLLPVETRMPLKFGPETLTRVTCARVCVRVETRAGRWAIGWGETPLSVQWGWPSSAPYDTRLTAMIELAERLTGAWAEWGERGHAMELGWDFVERRLPELVRESNASRAGEPMPWLAALITASAFDLALHDAYGRAVGAPVYETYTADYMNRDLGDFFESDGGTFHGRHPADYLSPRRDALEAWHLVGGLDPLTAEELRGDEPKDGHPVLLADWIRRDGLKCLKVKLRGTDAEWDYQRLTRVARVARDEGAEWLSADFNCTAPDAEHVNAILDRLEKDDPKAHAMLLYVEQPFPYDLEANRLDVRSVSARKPLFLDESAHDWRLVRLGAELGWSGVALKVCKTQSGALLSLCWAKERGMKLMVQDLTNPMFAQLPHLLLAAHTDTLMGVETNGMQFYPAASDWEAKVHPGCYERRQGMVRLETLRGAGFGYREEEIGRPLPSARATAGAWD